MHLPEDGIFREGDEIFRRLIEKSPIPMAVTDDKGRFQFLNDRFHAVFGYTVEDLPDIDAWWRRAYPDDRYREEVLSVWRESMGRDGRWDGSDFTKRDYRVTCADGTARVMKIAGTWISSKRLFLFLDITERIRAEEEASRLREQLFQAQKMEAIGRLAAGVAHDFSNLLTSILGYSTLMRTEEGLTDSVRKGIGEIERTAQRAADLTKRLLAFSRKQVLQPRVIDLHELIVNLEMMLQRLIGENVALSFRLEAGAPFLLADPGQIEQIIINLAVNARDAMPQGGTLAIATGNPDGGCGEWVELSVSDTGTGMDPEVKAHLFEPFFTTKEPGKGTGLGLSTVYGIVTQSGGRITVRSAPSQGTSFRILLPRAAENGETQTAEAATELDRGTETVVLVEDEGTLLVMAARILEDRGYRVIRMQDPAEALSFLMGPEGSRVDILITDVVMPHLSGRDLVERVWPANARLKILFISGYPMEDVLPGEIMHRRIEFLQKPFLPEDLSRKVRQVLNGRQTADPRA